MDYSEHFMKTMDITLRSHDVLIENNNSILRLFQVQGLDDAFHTALILKL